MAKTSELAPDVKISDLFPLTALPSKWLGWRRLLHPYKRQHPRNTGHYTAAARLNVVRSHWAAITAAQRTDWDTWAAANPPNDPIWKCAFDWTGQLAHATCNMRLLFLGAPLRADAPTFVMPPGIGLDDWGWPTDPDHYVWVRWVDVGSTALTVIVCIRFLLRPHGIRNWLQLIPVAAVDHPDRTYRINDPPGIRLWYALLLTHNTQGHTCPPLVLWIDKGEP